MLYWYCKRCFFAMLMVVRRINCVCVDGRTKEVSWGDRTGPLNIRSGSRLFGSHWDLRANQKALPAAITAITAHYTEWFVRILLRSADQLLANSTIYSTQFLCLQWHQSCLFVFEKNPQFSLIAANTRQPAWLFCVFVFFLWTHLLYIMLRFFLINCCPQVPFWVFWAF